MLRRPPRRPPAPSAVEIQFVSTPDGLVVDRVTLKPANAEAEAQLRQFIDRFRDPELDLAARIRETG